MTYGIISPGNGEGGKLSGHSAAKRQLRTFRELPEAKTLGTLKGTDNGACGGERL